MFIKLAKSFFPFKIKRSIKEHLGVPSLHWSLQNLKKKNFIPSVVLDIGAYEGYWTEEFLEVFPSAKVLMIEAQAKKELRLQQVKKKFANVDYAITLLSSRDGIQMNFIEDETGSHVAPGSNTAGILRSCSLDMLLESRGFPQPDFMKLDVQGHELEVLKGGSKALEYATVCLLEISFLNLGADTPLLAEMVDFMDKKNFQAYDISQFIRRPFDKALYQADIFFVKKDSFLISNQSW